MHMRNLRSANKYARSNSYPIVTVLTDIYEEKRAWKKNSGTEKPKPSDIIYGSNNWKWKKLVSLA